MQTRTVLCINCEGTGYVSGEPSTSARSRCPACGGAGLIVEELPAEPRKTWLDECAMMAMQAIIRKIPFDASPIDDGCEKEKMTACGSYSYAEAMLAEKMKREAKS